MRKVEMMNPLTSPGIREVLYDFFEDGTETLGGAPLNLAIHAHQLATLRGASDGTIVSCINSDRRGYKILDALHRLKISTSYIGKYSGHPTGPVSVFMKKGEPGYQIEAAAAWDHVQDGSSLKELAGQCRAVCFGSLAQHSPVSRGTISAFLPNALRRSASKTSI